MNKTFVWITLLIGLALTFIAVGCNGNTGKDMSVSAPTAVFTYTPDAPETSQTVTFKGTSTGSPTTWTWNFGDGSTSSLQNPTHVYSVTGTFTVTLRVSGAGGSNTISHTLTVRPARSSTNTAYSPGQPSSEQGKDNRHQGPPPEAYAACIGKKAGDAAKFVDPHGETITGTCELEGDQLVLRPDRSKGHSGSQRQGPPPEAYSACVGKKAGDPANFVNPQGETVTGTCEMEGDKLVLRPDHPKGNPDGRAMNKAGD